MLINAEAEVDSEHCLLKNVYYIYLSPKKTELCKFARHLQRHERSWHLKPFCSTKCHHAACHTYHSLPEHGMDCSRLYSSACKTGNLIFKDNLLFNITQIYTRYIMS